MFYSYQPCITYSYPYTYPVYYYNWTYPYVTLMDCLFPTPYVYDPFYGVSYDVVYYNDPLYGASYDIYYDEYYNVGYEVSDTTYYIYDAPYY